MANNSRVLSLQTSNPSCLVFYYFLNSWTDRRFAATVSFTPSGTNCWRRGCVWDQPTGGRLGSLAKSPPRANAELDTPTTLFLSASLSHNSLFFSLRFARISSQVRVAERPCHPLGALMLPLLVGASLLGVQRWGAGSLTLTSKSVVGLLGGLTGNNPKY